MSLTIELANVMLPELEHVRTDYRQDMLPISAGLYEAFLVNGQKGRDALLSYMHLLWTYRRQGTNKPWAIGRYLSRGLNLSPKRVRLAKGLLHRMGLVEYERDRTRGGKLGKVYTKLNLVSNPGPTGAVGAPLGKSPEKTTGAVSPLVVPVHQMLEERKGIKESAGVPAAADAVASSPAKSELARTPQEVKENKAVKKDPKAGKPKSDQPFITSLFFEKYTGRLGQKPAWTGKDGALLKADLVRLGVHKLAAAVRLFFDSPPRSVADFIVKAGSSYGVLHSQLPKLEEVLVKEERRLRLLKTCKACGKASETSGIDCPKCGEPDAYQKETKRAAQ